MAVNSTITLSREEFDEINLTLKSIVAIKKVIWLNRFILGIQVKTNKIQERQVERYRAF